MTTMRSRCWRISAVALACCLLLSALPVKSAEATNLVPAMPEALEFEGTIMVPVEAMARALGAKVVTTGDDIQATVPKGNSITIRFDGTPEPDNPTDATAKVKPLLCNETLYGQLQPLAEALGVKLDINEAKDQATVTLPGQDKPLELTILPANMPFPQYTESGVELYALNLADRNQTRLSFGMTGSLSIALAADGKRLAFTRGGSLYWRDLDSPIPTLLLKADRDAGIFYSHPNITPDGKTIYCAQHTADLVAQEVITGVVRIGTDGTKKREWPGLIAPRLSMDGKLLAYSLRNEENGESMIGILDTQKETLRTLGPGYHPVFSADGTRIAISRGEKTTYTLTILSLTGDKVTTQEWPAAQRVGVQVAGEYSPDGKQIVFESRGKGIFLADAGLTTARQLTNKPQDTHPLFSSDGSTVFFIRGDNLYAIAAEGGKERFLTSGIVVSEYLPTPNGKYLLCIGRLQMAEELLDGAPAPTDLPPMPQ